MAAWTPADKGADLVLGDSSLTANAGQAVRLAQSFAEAPVAVAQPPMRAATAYAEAPVAVAQPPMRAVAAYAEVVYSVAPKPAPSGRPRAFVSVMA